MPARPVQLVLRAVGGLGDAHIRDRHLRHVDESLDPVVPGDRGDGDRRFEVGRGDGHAEVNASAPFDGAVHGRQVCQVADDHLGAEAAQFLRAFVLSPHEGANLEPPSQQHLADVARSRRGTPGCTGHEDGVIMCRRSGHGLPQQE